MTIKHFLINFFSLCLLSCSTSTQTKNAPAAAMTALQLTSGHLSPAYPSDPSFQITLQGSYTSDLSCPILQENLLVEIIGPLPDVKVLSTLNIEEDGRFKLITAAKPGKYRVRLLNRRGNKVIGSKEIIANETQDRFQVDFSSCGF